MAARYSNSRAEIVLSESSLAVLIAAFGRAPRQLLTDAAFLRDAARFFAPFVVHESAHHAQFTWALAEVARGLRAKLYSQQWEREAFAAQAAFIVQKRRADPSFAAFLERLRAVHPSYAEEHDLPEDMDRDPAAHSLWIERTYRAAPTLARAQAKLIRTGLRTSLVAEAFDAAQSLLERSRSELRRLDLGRRLGP
jgi:cell pole-organizing protein PopZ